LPESSKPKTASEKQFAANRANAQHSSGPRTAEGKARSSQSARKYGFYGNAYNVPQLEDLEDVANLREDFAAAYHPRNPAEMEAVEQIAIAHQARLRAVRLEVGLFTSMLDQVYSVARDNVPGICDDLAAAATPRGRTIPEIRNFMLGEGFRRMKPEVWSGFLRHRAQVERFYHQAVEDFDQLKARRDEPAEDLRNEPNSAAQPEETEPLPPTQNGPKNGPEIEPENEPGRPPCPATPECPPESTTPPSSKVPPVTPGPAPQSEPSRPLAPCVPEIPLPGPQSPQAPVSKPPRSALRSRPQLPQPKRPIPQLARFPPFPIPTRPHPSRVRKHAAPLRAIRIVARHRFPPASRSRDTPAAIRRLAGDRRNPPPLPAANPAANPWPCHAGPTHHPAAPAARIFRFLSAGLAKNTSSSANVK
jgi:hypothetical protein